MQDIIYATEDYRELDAYLAENGIRSAMLVCGSSIRLLPIGRYFQSLEARRDIRITRFSDFQPNPLYESVVKGVELFNGNRCDSIIAVGGGSAMDVAKCIRLFCGMDKSQSYLLQKAVPNPVRLLAVPTTAGTGSEATRYAVVYLNGEKQSIADDSCIPQTVLMDVSALRTLPLYQKKCTMLDALCHGAESYWSVNSTSESRDLSETAIGMILDNMEGYLANREDANKNMLLAAHYAGRAINIAQTTAGHAMCYKLTSLYGIPHGHAAALCVSVLWPWMLSNIQSCTDPRGETYLRDMFRKLAGAFACREAIEAAEKFGRIVSSLRLPALPADEADCGTLCSTVNPIRLKNNPIRPDHKAIESLYRQLLVGENPTAGPE